MRIIKPLPIETFDFTPYGIFYQLQSPSGQSHSLPSMVSSMQPVTDKPMRLGLTRSRGGSYYCTSMERHFSTRELLFCGADPMVLVLSAGDPNTNPRAADLVAVLLKPGDAVLLHPAVWHDACRGVHGGITYYFMAHNDGSPDETRWFDLSPAPVFVNIGSRNGGSL